MADFLMTAPHLLKPENLPGQDSEAQLKHILDLNTSVREAPTNGSTNQAIDYVAEANNPAGAEKLSSRLLSTPKVRIARQVLTFTSDILRNRDTLQLMTP